MQSEFQQLSNGVAPLAGYASAEPERDPLLDFALRWWWLLVAGVLLGIIGVFVYLKVGPSSYSSTALIQVSAITGADPTDNAGQARSAAPNFAAEGTSTRMYQLVSEEAAGTIDVTASELASKERKGELTVKQQRGTNFIEITVVDEDPERARTIANIFAATMVADINERNQAQNDARAEQLQIQIDFTRQQLAAAQLFERERQLEADLREQQGRLLGLQASYQQETTRQLEVDQITNGQGDPAVIEGARADFERIMLDQIAAVEQNIESINEELAEVRRQIDELPPETDPLIETAFASAYAEQLGNLTSQYVADQIRALSAGPPLTQYGQASAPVSTRGIRTLALIGIAAGGALAAGLGFLIDFWRKRRREEDPAWRQVAVPGQSLSLDALLKELEEYQLSRFTEPRPGRPGDRSFSRSTQSQQYR